MIKRGLFALFLATGLSALSKDTLQFRGPHRNGVYQESGLLRQWPAEGPKELWSATGIGQGYASLAIAGGRLYVTGVKQKQEYVFALDLNGQKVWETALGEAHSGNGYPGSRGTPTVDGSALYVMSGMGRVFRLDGASGDIAWMVDLTRRFENAAAPYFGFAESVLVDGDRVVCTPGGKDATLAALDKQTGDTLWAVKGANDPASYCSIRVFDNGGIRQYITLTERSILAVNPEDGALLWRRDYPAPYDVHTSSPVFYGNFIYVSDANKQGGTLFELAADGRSVAEKWKEKSLDVYHGGMVQVNGHVYGAASNGVWICLDMATGATVHSIRGVGRGSVIYADGLLIGYGDKGMVGLFEASPERFELVSSFQVEKGRGQHWAHPVISDGKLYVRRGDALMVYQIKANAG